MPHLFRTIACRTYRSVIACPIRVRYSDVVGTFTRVDFAAGGADCHLVHIQPAQDGASMEVHFTGCHSMLADLGRVFEVHDITGENNLLSPWAGEYRQVGLFVGIIREVLDQNALMARLQQIGRPVEFVD